MDEALSVGDIDVPRFLYGTAWKDDTTQRLTELAIKQGFRGVDTANQRRHYHEAAVGQAIAASIAAGIVRRPDLFLQTKFTFRQSQDHRLPYDATAPVPNQVEQSFASSLQHLGTDFIDSYILHGPASRAGLTRADRDAWQAMEVIHDSGRARLLGVSNICFEQLQLLCQSARVRPTFVQNRCFAVTGWDRQIRQYCGAHGIIYQGFSLLTANREALAHRIIARIAERHNRSPSQIVFRFALDVGMMSLTGTTNADHMRADLDVYSFQLPAEEVQQIESLFRPIGDDRS